MRIPVALRAVLKQELDRMTDQDIIVPVTEPTVWAHSMHAGQSIAKNEEPCYKDLL